MSKYDDVPEGDRMAAGGMRDEDETTGLLVQLKEEVTALGARMQKAERELAAARFINDSLTRAIEKAKGHAGQIDAQILSDIVAIKAERDLLALVLRTIIKDDPDWLEVPEVAAAYEAITSVYPYHPEKP